MEIDEVYGGQVAALDTRPWTGHNRARICRPRRLTLATRATCHLPVSALSICRWAGPDRSATRHLADLGADVIKIEACQYPDWWRGVDNRRVVIEQRLYEKTCAISTS